MPIADSTLILEGQQDFSGGMNSSFVPNLIPDNSVYRSVNVTFRGGTPRTRPGFSQVVLNNGANSGLDYFTDGCMQGSFFYSEYRTDKNPCLISVVSGQVLKIDLSTYVVDRLIPLNNAGNPNYGFNFSGTAKQVYFCQAENYLIIQNGLDIPLIWDGDNLYQSGIGPAGSTGAVSQLHTIEGFYGTVMAYGQGRLFVANATKEKVFAGDLAFGGSTTQFTISSGTGAANSSTYTFTTTATHSYAAGDLITISGHSSSAGLNGTWTCRTGTSGTSIAINYNSVPPTTGSGGFATKANTGVASDLLRFTETNFLEEGGSLQTFKPLGNIVGMSFMPVQDVGTGQGDLLVFCQNGISSFSVATPRPYWKTTAGFQRVAVKSQGAVGQGSIVTTNGDIYYRSRDGLRTYRNARAEIDGPGQVPISAELNAILPYDTSDFLPWATAIVFDNRFLFTASPKIDYSGSSTGASSRPVTFSSIIALDFTTLSSVGAKRQASYDGLWRGLDITCLAAGLFNQTERAYMFCVSYDNNASNSLWEITRDLPYDVHNLASVPISCILETRAFSLGSPAEVKKLIRADLWISDLQGSCDFSVYWKPDEHPCFREWHSFTRCAQITNCVVSGSDIQFNSVSSEASLLFFNSAIRWYRLSHNQIFSLPIELKDGPDDSFIVLAALQSIGFSPSSVTRSGSFPSYTYTILGLTDEILDTSVVPIKNPATSACEDVFSPQNLQPQYRPQIRLPTPPADSDPIVGRPYYFGNDFQFRIEWTGQCRLSRFLVLGQRQLEQYQGTDYVEVV